jgi:mRNA interferase RelE/StbE
LGWTIDLTREARRDIQKLDRTVAKRITDFLAFRIAPADDPRQVGKAMSGPLAGYWRYRVGDHRIICDIQDKRVTVLVITIGHRKDVYR